MTKIIRQNSYIISCKYAFIEVKKSLKDNKNAIKDFDLLIKKYLFFGLIKLKQKLKQMKGLKFSMF